MRYAVLLTAVVLAAPFAFAEGTEMIELAGTPEQIGTVWGKLNKEIIVRGMEANYLKRAAAAGISKATLIERSAVYVRIAGEIAPHWLKEARAIARAAGVPEDLYIAYLDGAVRDRFLHECTSYAVSREHTKDGLILFHKTRDNKDRPQAVAIIDSSAKGINKFITVTNAGAIQCSMMVNEKGLAGSGDYPANRKKESSDLYLKPAKKKYRGLMGGTILRYIAERASSCAEALAIIEDFVAKGYYAGGKVGGNHFLFVDRKGVVLEVCNNARHVVSKVHTKKAYFSRRNKSTAARRLRAATKPIDFHLFHNVARDPSICLGSSISGMTAEIDPDHPELFTCAWVSLPVRAVAFPLFMGQRHTPACLLDGTAYGLGKKAKGGTARWEAIEQSVHTDKERLKKEVAASVAAGNPEPAHVEMLEQWSHSQAQMLLDALKNPKKAAE